MTVESGYSVKTGALRPQQKIIIIIIEYMFFRNILIDFILRQVEDNYSFMHCFRIARSAVAVHCDYRVARHPLEDTATY